MKLQIKFVVLEKSGAWTANLHINGKWAYFLRQTTPHALIYWCPNGSYDGKITDVEAGDYIVKTTDFKNVDDWIRVEVDKIILKRRLTRLMKTNLVGIRNGKVMVFRSKDKMKILGTHPGIMILNDFPDRVDRTVEIVMEKEAAT